MPFLIFFVSFIATTLSSMSGAGSSMITIPTWILLGYPLPVAITAANINGAIWTPVAAYNYLTKIKIDWNLVLFLVVFGLTGAFFGAKVIIETDVKILNHIIGIIILLLVCFVYFKREFGAVETKPQHGILLTGLLAMPLGFYETFFGSGNGIFTSYMLIKTQGLNLSKALGYYYLISFTWCCYGSYLLLSNGFGATSLIYPSSLGGILGGYVGSRIGRQKVSEFIRIFFLCLGVVLGLKLLLGY